MSFDKIIIQSNTSPSSKNQGLYAMAAQSDGKLWTMYRKYTNGDSYPFCAYSTNGGDTWTEDSQLNDQGANEGYWANVLVDNYDNVHFLWYAYYSGQYFFCSLSMY